MRLRLIEPRLQDSYGMSGCSPHGLVLSISPICGVGLSSLIRSMKIIPGSPFVQAMSTILSKTSAALSVEVGSEPLGLLRVYSASASTASMNSSVILTEMLKLLSFVLSSLQVMKFIISG